MKIFVSNKILKNRFIISDNSKITDFDIKTPLQLVFIDGNVVLKIFKILYLSNIDAYFVVKNLEEFILKMKLFKTVPIEIIDEKSSDLLNDLDENILNILGYKSKEEMSNKLYSMIKNYTKIDKNINMNRGIEISFRPKIIEAIKSSLENSSLYYSNHMIVHKIFNLLKNGKKTIKEIEKIDEKEENIYKTLKSLIYSGIVIKKNGEFSICDIFL